MEKLLSADAQFIRCVKPNSYSRHNHFDHELVVRQLRYTGVLETIRIRRSGFPTRLIFPDFIHRYMFIGFPLTAEVSVNPKNCKHILERAGCTDYHIGKTKVFLKYWHTEKLDSRMDQLLAEVVTCQRVARGRAARARYTLLRNRVLRDVEETESLFAEIERRSDRNHAAMVKLDRLDKERFDLKKRQMILGELRGNIKQRQQENRAPPPAQKPPSPVHLHPNQQHPYQQPQQKKKAGPPPVSQKPARPGGVNGVPRSAIPTSKPQVDEEIIQELTYGMKDIGAEAWCKVYFMEKRCRLSDFQIKSPAIIVDGYAFQHPGRLGFGALANPLRDQETKKVREHIGKGVQLEIDSEGNVWATRLGKNEVFVKGCFEPENHCISAEVIESMGRLPRNQAMKVFDIVEYKAQLALEAKKGDGQIDHHRLHKLSIVSLSFVKDKVEDFNTPCWISLCVLPAIRMDNPKVLRDVGRLLKAYRTAAQIEKTLMGRESSRKWARVHKRQSHFEKEERTEGRRARIEAFTQAKAAKKPVLYSWEGNDDDVSMGDTSMSESQFNRNDRFSEYSEGDSIYYNGDITLDQTPGYGAYGAKRSSRRKVFRAVSIRNADAFKQRELRTSMERNGDQDLVTSNSSGFDLEKKREWARVKLIKKERELSEEF